MGRRGKILWKLFIYATVWKIWLERNRRVLRNVSKSVEEITQSIVWNVSEWASIRKKFGEISVTDFNRSWAAILNGHCHTKVVHIVEWLSPPVGTFKLNFDGSFSRSTNQVCIGGVVKDWNGNVIRNFSVPVVSMDANEV